MNGGQLLYVASLVTVVIILIVGSLIFPVSVFTALALVIFGFAEMFLRALTPKGEEPQTPLTIFKESELWQGIAGAYYMLIILVVLYHLGVERLSFFDNINMPIFLALILGGIAGPIVVHVRRTYRLLGGKVDE